jgi:site-specific recombinase XerD
MGELVPHQPSGLIAQRAVETAAIPALVADAGEDAIRRFLEFFAATIRNKNTRVAYYNDVRQFFAWCERRGIDGLERIEPIHVALYVEQLQHSFSKPTVKQHLAAVRMLFDWLVTGQMIRSNPARSVRGPKHVVKRGKTPVLVTDQARELLEGMDTSSVVGLRDRALIGVMTYTFARVGAVVGMTVDDYYPEGKRWSLRLHEKGGKRHDMPAHHKLESYLDEYLDAAGIRGQGRIPLFRSTIGKTGILTGLPMHRVDVYRMIRRRAADASFQAKIGCHTYTKCNARRLLLATAERSDDTAKASDEQIAAARQHINEQIADPLDFDDNIALARLDVRIGALREERQCYEAVLGKLLAAAVADNKVLTTELLANWTIGGTISTAKSMPRGARCVGSPVPPLSEPAPISGTLSR